MPVPVRYLPIHSIQILCPVLGIQICIDSGRLDPDPDPGGQKGPTKSEKEPQASSEAWTSLEFVLFEEKNSVFSA